MAATYIVLMGVQGAGKGTQAPKLAEKYHLPHISTGALFRAMKTQDTPLAREIQATMAAGKLVSDQQTFEVLKERLSQGDAEYGAILDGFPRNLAQAEMLDNFLKQLDRKVTIVPFLELNRDLAIKRITDRWECSLNEDHKYNLTTKPPQIPGKCDIDNAPLIQRKDDTPEAAAKRINDFFTLTTPLLDYFRQRKLLRPVNADQSIDKVTDDLVSVIDEAVQHPVA